MSGRQATTGLALVFLAVASAVGAQLPTERVAKRMRAPLPARLTILEPANLAANQEVAVEWRYDGESVDAQTSPSLTWYYATDRSGSDRKRITTLFQDSFEGELLQRWLPVNALRDDWDVNSEGGRRGFRYVRMRRGGEPIVSLDHFANDFVVSARLRPLESSPTFGIGVRVNRETRDCYALRGAAELLNPENLEVRDQQELARAIVPGKWYWYELSVRNRAKKEVVVRGRIWDDQHQSLLAVLNTVDYSGPQLCPKGQRIGLLPGADYSEVYVDPWSARWLAPRGSFVWDTRSVPNGEYYLIAVLNEGGDSPPRTRPSEFRIKVSHDR